MNRLVLIGNGYDLAAGLKTSYEDFLVAYIKDIVNQVIETKKIFQDQLLTVEKIGTGGIDLEKLNSITALAGILRNRNFIIKNQHEFGSYDHEGELIKDEENYFEIYLKSEFFEKTLKDLNWRDIEGFYFKSLVDIYKGKVLKHKTVGEYNEEREYELSQKRSAQLLNIEFEHIKKLLANYLANISAMLNYRNAGYPFSVLENINKPMDVKLFKEFFNKADTIGKTTEVINKGLIVNFNYTNLLSNHLNWNKNERENFETINIHGSVQNPSEIIFGYGDDTHPMYSELELSGEDEYLSHLKSFRYPLSNNYLHLINFLEYEQFEVQILGHSLGLSDRVLLKSIFEHDNCKCIRLFHQGRNDERGLITKKYMALARHFDNKMIMRNKIVPFNLSDKLH